MPKTDGVPPEPRATPNIDAILAILKPNGELDNAAKGQAEAMSKIGNLYKKIEADLKGNRAAVALIRKLDRMSEDKRNDMIRTLEPLLVERGYILDNIDPDLADAPRTPPPPMFDEDDDKGGDNSNVTALDAARENLSGGDPVGGAAAGGISEDEANAFVKGAKPKLAASPKKDGVDGK